MVSQPPLRFFKCPNSFSEDLLINGSYIKYNEPNSTIKNSHNKNIKYQFFDTTYDVSIVYQEFDFKSLCLITRANISIITGKVICKGHPENLTNHLENYEEYRKRICEFVLTSRAFVLNFQQNQRIKKHLNASVRLMFENIKRFKEIPVHVLLNQNNYNNRNYKTAQYNYIHLILDLAWLKLTTIFKTEDDVDYSFLMFEEELKDLLKDLVFLSVVNFNNFKSYSYVFCKSPYSCHCFKELLLLIQLYLEKLSLPLFKDFWYYFNEAVINELNLKTEDNLKNTVIALWLLDYVAKIQGFNERGEFKGNDHLRITENPELIDICINIITSDTRTPEDEPLILISLQLIAGLHINWWREMNASDALIQLWEFYYARFFQEPEVTSINSLQFYDFNRQSEVILQTKLKEFTTSFDVFLWFIGKYFIKEYYFWRIVDREIISKLDLNMISTLKETGFRNLIQFFFMVMRKRNIDDMAFTIHSLLCSIPFTEFEITTLIWNTHFSMLFLYGSCNIDFENNIENPIEICIVKNIKNLENLDNNKNFICLGTIVLQALNTLFENFIDLKWVEQFIINSFHDDWIFNYLQESSTICSLNFLQLVEKFIPKIDFDDTEDFGYQWFHVFNRTIIPACIDVIKRQDISQQVIEVLLPIFLSHRIKFKKILIQCTRVHIPVTVIKTFLNEILEYEYFLNGLKEQQDYLIPSWLRIAVTNNDRKEVDELTLKMTQMSYWYEIVGDLDNCTEESDPLYAAIIVLGQQIPENLSVRERNYFINKYEFYFGHMEVTILSEITLRDNNEPMDENVVFRIFKAAGLLFAHCSPVIYNANDYSCIFCRFISLLMLPYSIMNGREPPMENMEFMKKTWHLFVRGVTKLNFREDDYLKTTLVNLVQKYVPFMFDASSPILQCLSQNFDSVAYKFILKQVSFMLNDTSSNSSALKAMKLILTITKIFNDNIRKLTLFAKIFFPTLFDQFMQNEDLQKRVILLEIIENIYTSDYELSKLLKEQLVTVIHERLMYKPNCTFNLIDVFTKRHKNVIKEIIPEIESVYRKAERLRGPNFINSIRDGLEMLKTFLKQ